MSNNKEGSMRWPYPVRYGKEREIHADVLIIGGGLAGSHAAINAAKKGMKIPWELPLLLSIDSDTNSSAGLNMVKPAIMMLMLVRMSR